MINAIINGIWSVLQGLISVILAPIDLLLANIPFLNESAQGISNFVAIVKSAIVWAWDIFPPLTKVAVSSLFVAIAFFWSATFAVKMIKIAYGWIQKIKFW